MNWREEVTAKRPKLADALAGAEVEVSAGEHEGEPSAPAGVVAAAERAVSLVAEELGLAKDEFCVTVEGHVTTEGEGFRPAHVVITISRVDTEGVAKQEAEQEVARAEVAAREQAVEPESTSVVLEGV